ncbi:MAG: ankyrin repeat domain-containing protein [Verrucomicrobia bacterium]|nr:ankyrin repeat domain-containing protein [Verrucomicrobiota bacterium]
MSAIGSFLGSLVRPSRETLWTNLDQFNYVCERGDEREVARLLEDPECRAAINEPDYRDGTTPLQAACSHNHTRIMEMLIEAGADVNVKERNGMTPLHRACQRNDENMIKFLVFKGADVEAKDNNGHTPDQLSHLDVKSFWFETANQRNKETDLFYHLFPALTDTIEEFLETPEAPLETPEVSFEAPQASSSAVSTEHPAAASTRNKECNVQ